MKKVKRNVIFKVCIAIMAVAMLMSSCTANKSGRKHLERILFCDYAAEIEYVFEYKDTTLAGTGRITRGENVRFDILSPDPYTGISVQGDAADKIDTISISYSGIKADIPKSILNKLSLVLSMFSDTAANGIENAPGTAFMQSESDYSCDFLNECVPYEAHFSIGKTECVYTYDSITGIPLCLCADTGEVRAEIKIKKFKTEQ